MTEFYQIAYSAEGRMFCHVNMACDRFTHPFQGQSAIDNWDPRTLGIYGPKSFNDSDFFEPLLTPPLVSSKFRETILDAVQDPSRLQFLPVVLETPYGKDRIDGYSLMHVLDVRKCLDISKTRGYWTKEPPPVYVVTDQAVHLYRRMLRGAEVFRVEGFPRSVIVVESIRAALCDAGIIDCRFRPVEVAD